MSVQTHTLYYTPWAIKRSQLSFFL